jgi:hypothetical protein
MAENMRTFRGTMPIRGLLFFFLAVSICGAQAPNPPQSPNFDPKPWLEDFHQILDEMSSHYANLEWALDGRKMDLPRLRSETEGKLRESSDDGAARRVLDKFLAGFGDGHLELRWPKTNSSSTSAKAAPQNLCARLGYNSPLHPGLDFSSLSDFAALDSPEANLFPGGLLHLQNHTVIGVIRLALFSEHAYPQVCEQAARELHLAEDAQCDEKCDDQLEVATANLLTAALVKRAEALRAAGATRLLIDITNNGGGSEWVEAVPRALVSTPLRDSKMAFIKHPHWITQLQDQLRHVQTDIKNGASSPISLSETAATLEQAIEVSRQPCDRTSVSANWQPRLLSACQRFAIYFRNSLVREAWQPRVPLIQNRSIRAEPILLPRELESAPSRCRG